MYASVEFIIKIVFFFLFVFFARLRRRTSGSHTAGTQFRHSDTHPPVGASLSRVGTQLQPFDEGRPADDRVRRRPGRPDTVLDDRLNGRHNGIQSRAYSRRRTNRTTYIPNNQKPSPHKKKKIKTKIITHRVADG